MDEYVPYQLAILSSRLSRSLEEVFGREHGLTRPEWRVLALASEVESCRASELVIRSGMDAVAIHRAIKRLDEKGLIERSPADADKRARPLRVTEQGRAVYEAVIPHALELEQRLLSSLDERDAENFRAALRQLMSADF